MRILVVNAGSSSLKLRVLDAEDRLLQSLDLPAVEPEAPGSASDGAAHDELARTIRDLGEVDAVGHRVVHGGIEFSAAVTVDAAILARLWALTDLAPLHQPRSLTALEAVRAVLPSVPQVACFDTAFHAGLDAAAATYALPPDWRDRWPLRRFGFHGLSHAYVARHAAELLERPLDGLRIVTCHLGAGASLAAVRDGRSVDTTMGFTPLEGLVMATRSGNVDPGLVLWLQQQGGLDVEEIADGLEHQSGLVGLAGTDDMRAVIDAAGRDEPRASLGLAVYLHRLRAGIASMAAAIGGLDGLVFTGRSGERAPVVRAGAVAGLPFLGLQVDEERNASLSGDGEIGSAGATARILVIESREDLEIARQVRGLVGRR